MRVGTALLMSGGGLSSGIGLLVFLAIAGLIFAVAAGQVGDSQSWGEAASALVGSVLTVFGFLSLIIFVVASAYLADFGAIYRSADLIKESGGEPYLDIRKGPKRILAYRFSGEKILVIYADGEDTLCRKSFYRSRKALVAMRELLRDEHSVEEVVLGDDELAAAIQRLNSDQGLRDRTRQKLTSGRSRRAARTFRESEPLVDLECTFPRAITRLGIVIDVIWAEKQEPPEVVFELAFREVQADDIRRDREGMNWLQSVLAVGQDR